MERVNFDHGLAVGLAAGDRRLRRLSSVRGALAPGAGGAGGVR